MKTFQYYPVTQCNGMQPLRRRGVMQSVLLCITTDQKRRSVRKAGEGCLCPTITNYTTTRACLNRFVFPFSPLTSLTSIAKGNSVLRRRNFDLCVLQLAFSIDFLLKKFVVRRYCIEGVVP